MQILVLLSAFFVATLARKGFGPTEQEWGFVEVRPDAQIFWWLHETRAAVEKYTDRPLVIWLQGGPGGSSSGYGNFAELGPLDSNLNERNTTWTNDVNVLFVDNPVGTGFSYTAKGVGYCTTNRQVADDFVAFLTEFYKTLPELKATPLYIFSESYGGKMTAEIALAIDQAVKAGKLDISLEAIGLGDSWISPIDSILTWGPYLLNLGLVDEKGVKEINDSAQQTKDVYDSGDHGWAFQLWGVTENVVLEQTSGVDFYNVLTKIPGFNKQSVISRVIKGSPGEKSLDSDIDDIMNNYVNKALGINRRYGEESNRVFNEMSLDFLNPVTDIVEQVLNSTDIKVIVYNGQLDLIVDTPGTVKWVDNLKYPDSDKWQSTFRFPFTVNGIIEGFHKSAGNLHFYWVSRSGHMVPNDNPAGMRYILQEATNNFGMAKK